MMDWDTPGPYHADANATVRHLGDVEELVRDYTSRHALSHACRFIKPQVASEPEVSERKTVPEFKERVQRAPG